VISVKEIDNREKNKITLNQLEELKMVELIDKLKPDVVYIDAVDVNEERFSNSIKSHVQHKPKKVVSKHKADDIYPIVSAASIIAKNERDSIIEKLSEEYGNMGSGYPSDKRTIEFIRKWIKKNKNVPHFVRKSWETTKNILIEEIGTKKITDYFD
ncbi:MAG: ribonuclease HII, partial [Promethearchaeota archaeon]